MLNYKRFMRLILHYPLKNFIRRINRNSLTACTCNLSFESWQDIFYEKDVNKILNSFLKIFLRLFYSNFPIVK